MIFSGGQLGKWSLMARGRKTRNFSGTHNSSVNFLVRATLRISSRWRRQWRMLKMSGVLTHPPLSVPYYSDTGWWPLCHVGVLTHPPLLVPYYSDNGWRPVFLVEILTHPPLSVPYYSDTGWRPVCHVGILTHPPPPRSRCLIILILGGGQYVMSEFWLIPRSLYTRFQITECFFSVHS